LLNYRELKAKLAELEAEIIAVRAEGEILADARIDSSKPGEQREDSPQRNIVCA